MDAETVNLPLAEKRDACGALGGQKVGG